MPYPASIGDSIQNLSNEFFVWLPRLGAAIVILLVAWIIARVLRRVIRRVMGRLDLEGKIRSSKLPSDVTGLFEKISLGGILAGIVYWLVFLTGLSLALTALQIPRLDDALATLWSYVPNLLGAALILAVAWILARVVSGAVRKLAGDTALGRIAATVAPILILTIATFMALVQLELATQIVVATYVIVLGGIALGAALAFGLGGRDAAQKMLDGAYDKSREG